VAGVVKADAYGLGMVPVARALAAEGCDSFFVARIEEGMALRPAVPEARIFVLDGAPPAAIPALIAHKLTPVLNSLDEIAAWAGTARGQRGGLDAALQVDTGMNRLGLPPYELTTLAAEARTRLAGLRLVLIMSHLASSDDPASPQNAEQLRRFRMALAMLPPAPASLSSSGGIMLGPDYAFDMVRPGIALYGGNPCPIRPNPFAVAAVLSGRILQRRRIDKDEAVGYGATYRSARPSLLATVALGYADGLMRAIGNRGVGAIGGVRVPVVGRVSMDLVTLDVSEAPEGLSAPGGLVEFFGDTVGLDELAAAAGTVNYEILTSVSPRVQRHYLSGTAT
ncbi:MAG: alanine racemase, partial [Pseudomonadota bacterium]|nr:alanine racemase [Pseudomonadota bacterium]